MKKQLLLLTSCLLITISAQCMQPEDKKSSLLAAADSNTQNPSLDFFKRHSETLEQELARIVKNSGEADESKNDQTFDHADLLRQLNIDAQLIRKSIDTCSNSAVEEEKSFTHDHMVLSIHISKFHAGYLVEPIKTKVCVSAPSYLTLLRRTKRYLDAAANDCHLTSQEVFLVDTLSGLENILTVAKDAHLKNVK